MEIKLARVKDSKNYYKYSVEGIDDIFGTFYIHKTKVTIPPKELIVVINEGTSDEPVNRETDQSNNV